MTLRSALFGERARIRAAGLFTTRRQAAAAARRLRDLGADALQIVGPCAELPDGAAISSRHCRHEAPDWRCLLRLHLVGGAAGAALGVLLYTAWALAGKSALLASPRLALFALTAFTGLIGMMVAGLAGLRPDHMRVVAAVRRAARQGRWAVIVDPASEGEADVLLNELEERSYRVVRSL